MAGALAKLLKQNKKGAAALEFALVAPILFLMLLGTLEFGLTIFTDSTMQQALRATARQGMVKAMTKADVDSVMQYYMQGLWAGPGIMDVCVRAYPNIVNVQEPMDINGNRLPGPSAITVEPELASFAATPQKMFEACGPMPANTAQAKAIMLYTAQYQWGGKTKLLAPLVPPTLNAVTMVRNEFGT